jgi:dynein heavy chain
VQFCPRSTLFFEFCFTVFSLPPYYYSYQSNTANTSLDTILSIQPKDSSSGGGETRESVVYRQAAEMLEKLPPNYIPHEVKARLQKMGAIAPMNIFLRQEIDRMQRVITIVRNTLKDLRLAIEGTIIMSEVRHSANFGLSLKL